MPKFDPLLCWTGRSIAHEIVKAVEAISDDNEIVTFKAGENMPITCAFVDDTFYNNSGGMIPEYAWDGEKWREIGYL